MVLYSLLILEGKDMDKFIKIAECDGGIEVVERELYDRIYGEVASTFTASGAAAVRALVQRSSNPVRTAILKTIVADDSADTIRLRSADEVDYYQKRAA